MKLVIKQNLLMEHLNYVIRGISTKNLIPILSCIKFDLNSDGLSLISTDNDIAIKTFIKKENIEEIDSVGSFVVSGRYIYDIIRKLPNESINIEEIFTSKIVISTLNSSFTLNCNNVYDYPAIELEESKTPIKVKQETIKMLVNQTSFATSTQESRPVLTGINFKIEKNLLEVIATDSYRLAKKTIELKTLSKENINIIVPTKNLLELTRLFFNDEEEVEMHVFSNKVIFQFGTIQLLTRLINGTYPDISKLIPESFLIKMKVDKNLFYNSIDRAALLTNEADKNTIKLESTKNTILVSSNIPEVGNVEEKINIEKNSEEEIKIAFSSKYMLDALKAIESDEVEMLFNGEVKPIIIKNLDNESLIQLILPIRTY